MEKIPHILEFEVIAPTDSFQQIGDIYKLNEVDVHLYGYYCSKDKNRCLSLLFMLDHTDHYRISKLSMQGNKYVIPKNRKVNYVCDIHPDLNKFKVHKDGGN